MDPEVFQAIWKKLTKREIALLIIGLDAGHITAESLYDDISDEEGYEATCEMHALVDKIEAEEENEN